jgi:hypothetical protein
MGEIPAVNPRFVNPWEANTISSRECTATTQVLVHGNADNRVFAVILTAAGIHTVAEAVAWVRGASFGAQPVTVAWRGWLVGASYSWPL